MEMKGNRQRETMQRKAKEVKKEEEGRKKEEGKKRWRRKEKTRGIENGITKN